MTPEKNKNDEAEESDLDLESQTNGRVAATGSKLAFRFDKDGHIKASEGAFKSLADLQDHLASILGIEPSEDGQLRGTLHTEGKYVRTNADGDRVFTFGDPILDLITDEFGRVHFRDRAIDLSAAELASPRSRRGGNRSIDLQPFLRELMTYQVARAATGDGDMTIIAASADGADLASTNPSQQNFERQGDCLRFKAWRKSYVFYWSMGAEIETWGHDFDTASIESTYFDLFYGQICDVVDTDSDSDTDDDYVDEYEWGVNAPQPRRVVSLCRASWHGENFSGFVEAGSECPDATWASLKAATSV